MGRNVVKGGTSGKVCPNGHFTSAYNLRRFEVFGAIAKERKKAKKGDVAQGAKPAPVEKDLRRDIRPMSRAEALDEFYRAAVSAFDALVNVFPEKSQARALIEGSLLGKLVNLNRGEI